MTKEQDLRKIRYNVSITSREDNTRMYTHHDISHCEAMYWVGQYGGDPEYDVDVVELSQEPVREPLPFIH